ncbi:PEX16-like protein [Mya arenaria]|uniref:Peroxisomal membrane protein PEX16 n=1 Tax=Mya arenaria TaxID=6604 RepID=A0ABY7DVJ1_MYAAR|nr:PEX16-like protein [Mya arenaria]
MAASRTQTSKIDQFLQDLKGKYAKAVRNNPQTVAQAESAFRILSFLVAASNLLVFLNDNVFKAASKYGLSASALVEKLRSWLTVIEYSENLEDAWDEEEANTGQEKTFKLKSSGREIPGNSNVRTWGVPQNGVIPPETSVLSTKRKLLNQPSTRQKLFGENKDLNIRERAEVKRRNLMLLYYLMRSPFYDQYTKTRLMTVFRFIAQYVPLTGLIMSKSSIFVQILHSRVSHQSLNSYCTVE